MKKTILIFVSFFLYTSNLFAQKINDNWGHFYLDGSLNYTSVKYDDKDIYNEEPQQGWRFGTGIYTNQGKYFSWEIGAGISKKQFSNYSYDNNGTKISNNTEIFSWDIPLIFHPQIAMGEYWAFAGDIGIAYENRYKGKTITDNGTIKTYEDLRFVKKENNDPSPGFKKHDAYVILGAGIRFRNVKISAQHNFGIVDMDANKVQNAYMESTMFKITGIF